MSHETACKSEATKQKCLSNTPNALPKHSCFCSRSFSPLDFCRLLTALHQLGAQHVSFLRVLKTNPCLFVFQKVFMPKLLVRLRCQADQPKNPQLSEPSDPQHATILSSQRVVQGAGRHRTGVLTSMGSKMQLAEERILSF